ncbi:hypothetical protein [Paenibacillus xerothermodurans]|uniref:Uncharacterized protein n=1 Tax=Paenibacillus xerothermodurans TaxID=1977292 RepID=A0A2W1P015_PAEXE|nr:hypothetical protein [Paenibacillus xerothermodurans]PZE20478.1 hypothetical protein CBW46_013680 [Paenibacillus xerothermodurans]
MKKFIYITALVVVVVAGGGLVAYNYAVDWVLRGIASSASQDGDGSGEQAMSAREDAPSQQVMPNGQPPEDSAGRASGDSPDNGSTGQPAEAGGAGAANPSTDEGPAANDAANGSAAAQPNNSTPTGNAAAPPSKNTTYSAEITPDKAEKVQESITGSEKAQVTSILLKKLSVSELELFVKMAGDGLSVEEKKEAKKVILQKLTEDEYNQLISIAAKYGLSQGKNYDESQKQMAGNAVK